MGRALHKICYDLPPVRPLSSPDEDRIMSDRFAEGQAVYERA
jgi:hypothetical protein